MISANLWRRVGALALIASLAACGGEAPGGPSETSAEDAVNRVGATGVVEPRIVSGIALPELSAQMIQKAQSGGGMPCGIPLLPDYSNGRVFEEGRQDGAYETATSPGEVAAYHQAFAEWKNISMATSGSGDSIEQRVDTHDMRKCKITIEGRAGGGSEVTVIFSDA